MDGNLFHKAPSWGESFGFFEGNMVAAVCLEHHLNICRYLFGLKIENRAYIEDKSLTRWTGLLILGSLGMKGSKF